MKTHRQSLHRANRDGVLRRDPDFFAAEIADVSRRRVRVFPTRLIIHVLLPSIAFAIFSRTLLLEEEEEGAGLVGTYDGEDKYRPDDMRPNQVAYLESIEKMTERYSRMAHFRLRRYFATSAGAIACASAVPVVVAARFPGWIAAALGALAALAQGIQQILQDQRLGAESHAIAVEMSTALRRFRYEAEEVPERERDASFRTFVDQMEEIQHLSGSRMFELMREHNAPTNSSVVRTAADGSPE
ncbi:SLATT domain-containing protein [Frankia sp. AgB32]|uniref:SLATT domain-containing protein n=1 Tax=Frankia sp. AgB32 TaxID=631119 RepID=UPI00200E0C5A|nr:SLATT domain-containing protein [Frankia sp. AgB32]MCK9898416.1 SLATT domain-containing protein [Frankia sp. AgB32]